MAQETSLDGAPEAPPFGLSFPEFVGLMAFLMALTALSIDIMLPALPQIGRSLGVADENHRQLVISVYFTGFALGQLIFGPISDWLGRKRPLVFGIGLYALATALAFTSQSFGLLLAARAFQGLGAASPRIIAQAIVRDRFAGRDMARVMSFTMMVFLVVPILGPAFGEALLFFVGNWRGIFVLLFAASVIALAWTTTRLPETLEPSNRIGLSGSALYHAAKTIVTTRQTIGYVVAMGFIFGLLLSYITSAEQIFVDLYQLGALFPLAFGAIASAMIAASVVNAVIVKRVGMRPVSHFALLGISAVCALMAVFGYPAKPPLIVFCLFMGMVFFCFGLIMPNFNALSMEPMGKIAGTASSIAGFYSTAIGAVLATFIGQSFDGTIRPVAIGISILCGCALVTVLIAERFRLGQPQPRGVLPAARQVPGE